MQSQARAMRLMEFFIQGRQAITISIKENVTSFGDGAKQLF